VSYSPRKTIRSYRERAARLRTKADRYDRIADEVERVLQQNPDKRRQSSGLPLGIDQIAAIQQKYREGLSLRQVAAACGVSYSSAWAHTQCLRLESL